MAAAIGTFVNAPHTNVVQASSFRGEEGRKKLSSGCSTLTRGTPLKPNSRTLLTSVSSSHPLSSSRCGNRNFSRIQCVSVSDVTTPTAIPDLPLKEIPGTYGLPFFGAVKDRLDFFWFQKVPKFYEARRDKYNSTVYRTNVPPGPPFFPDPRVIVVLDEKSYPILFDLTKVLKKDIFVGTYVPSLKLTGGYRVLSYLDPSEPKHELLKQFAFEILKFSGPRVIPEMSASLSDVFTNWEAGLKKDGKVDFSRSIQLASFKFVLKAFTNHDPYEEGESSIGEGGPNDTLFWVLAQIGPITGIPAPWYLAPVVEIFLHTLRLPTILVKAPYEKLLKYFRTYGTELLDIADKQLSLDREEALHNLVFLTCFNTWGGVQILFPSILKYLGGTSAEYQKELSAEVKKVVEENGGQLGIKILDSMPLVQSAVYEVLRIAPPVPYQYAKAKSDFVIQSHEASFQVKKGETLAGYMPVACKDPKVFVDPESFLPKRFVGEEGKDLLKYVLWSNGPQTEEPTVHNKHCAGKNFVLTVSHLFVASIYLKYDKLQVDATNATVITSLEPSPVV